MPTRRTLLRATIGTALTASALGGYAMGIEPHWLETTRTTLPVSSLPSRWHGRTLVHLSDLHLGPRVDDSYLHQVFAVVDALAPDIVVYTGDFIDREPDILDHAARLAPFMPLGKRATFGVLGNHDYGRDWKERALADSLTGILVSCGIRILHNETAVIDGLAIAGFDDLWAGRCNIAQGIASLPAAMPAIALAHNPDSVDLPGWDAFSGWILSGHTHGGQCRAPFLPPPLLPVENRRYIAGVYHIAPRRSLYISRGIGHLLKARFCVRPELACFTLRDG